MKVVDIRHSIFQDDIVYTLLFGCSHCDCERALSPDIAKFCPNCGAKLNKPRIKNQLSKAELVKCINIATGIVKT